MNKKIYRYFLPATLAVLTLSGCANGNDPDLPGRNGSPAFTATIGGSQSRAYDRTWEVGDEIGITGCNRTNVCYVTSGGDGSFTVKTANEQIYFHDNGEATFTAYYPWNNSTATKIEADTKDQTKQKSFDYLWAKATGKKDAPNVAFTFAHKMAKVTLTVKAGEGMVYDELKAVKFSLSGISHTGTFDEITGSTAVGAVSDAWTFSNFAKYNDTDKTITFSLIFFPQAFNQPLDLAAVLDLPDNKNYSLKANLDFTTANKEKDGDAARNEWIAGRQYDLTVTLNKTEILLNKCVITAWTVVSGDDIIVD